MELALGYTCNAIIHKSSWTCPALKWNTNHRRKIRQPEQMMANICIESWDMRIYTRYSNRYLHNFFTSVSVFLSPIHTLGWAIKFVNILLHLFFWHFYWNLLTNLFSWSNDREASTLGVYHNLLFTDKQWWSTKKNMMRSINTNKSKILTFQKIVFCIKYSSRFPFFVEIA